MLRIALATSVLAAIALCFPAGAQAATCNAQASGSWQSVGTWDCGEIPD